MPLTKEPTIDTKSPVLVTGATGYVAGVLISKLLEKGCTVHATVRDPTKTERFQYLLDIADKSSGSIKFFHGDLLEPGSFKEAMAGCSVVFHTASPFALTVKDPRKDLIEPAVSGTENVLKTCCETPSVKKVVVTSSVVAMYCDAQDTSAEAPLTEEDWNRTATLSHNPYSMSKAMAEIKAWTIAGQQTQWTMATINPSFVLGPGAKYHASSESFDFIKKLGDTKNYPDFASGVPALTFGVVDVRDVALAHIAAGFTNATGRFITSAACVPAVDLGGMVATKYGANYNVATSPLSLPKSFIWLIAPYALPISRQFVQKNFGVPLYIDNGRSKNVLGLEYADMTPAVQDMFQQIVDAGAAKPKTT